MQPATLEQIKKRMKEQGYTVPRLATQIGWSVSALYKKLNSERRLTDEEYGVLARVLGLPIAVEVPTPVENAKVTLLKAQLLTAKEMAQIFDITPETYARMVQSGRAPGMKAGNRYYCTAEALHRFMATCGKPGDTRWSEMPTPDDTELDGEYAL